MSLDPLSGAHTASPASSGRSSPVPRLSRRAVEDGLFKADKSFRRYATAIERTLSTWETSPEDWADYIAFLGRLLKTLQSHPSELSLLPHSDLVATRLALCLNPSLPSGVHQKALELYNYVFTLLGRENLADELLEFLPGLSGVLSFASLTVRPGLYTIFEDHILQLYAAQLRPALKSLVLSLLPALEDDGSDDFEHAHSILHALQKRFQDPGETVGYFWQCVFLAVMTSPSRRQGAFNYLIRHLPTFGTHASITDDATTISDEADAVVQPEPGLMMRCFACGLSDANSLVQRSFLDLLVSHLPIHSIVVQKRSSTSDVECLMSAALQVLLRRDMSLNKRLWGWFLGPDPKEGQSSSPMQMRQPSFDNDQPPGLKYFSTHGRKFLEDCLLKMFCYPSTKPSDRAKPFRICLSLMDRWEIGGTVIPRIFITALRTVYDFSLISPKAATAEVVKSASLFFDGVESQLIWANLFLLLEDASKTSSRDAKFFAWITRNFNIREEEMLTIHIPCMLLHILYRLENSLIQLYSASSENLDFDTLFAVVAYLISLTPARAFDEARSDAKTDSKTARPASSNIKPTSKQISSFYQAILASEPSNLPPFVPHDMANALCRTSVEIIQRLLSKDPGEHLDIMVKIFIQLTSKCGTTHSKHIRPLLDALRSQLKAPQNENRSRIFRALDAMLDLIMALQAQRLDGMIIKDFVIDISPEIISTFWSQLSPNTPRFHVEAVRRIWQVEDITSSDDAVSVSLSHLMHYTEDNQPLSVGGHLEAARRFSVLWSHSVSPTMRSAGATKKSDLRRGSSFWAVEPKQLMRRNTVLHDPLLLCLEGLTDVASPTFEFVRQWLAELPSLDSILQFLLEQALEVPSSSLVDVTSSSMPPSRRTGVQRLQNAEYYLMHIDNLLAHVPEPSIRIMLHIDTSSQPQHNQTSAVARLASACAKTLTLRENPISLVGKSIKILSKLLQSPESAQHIHSDLEILLIEEMLGRVSSGVSMWESELLQLIDQTLKVRLDSLAMDHRVSDGNFGSTSQDHLSPIPHSLAQKQLQHVASPTPQLLSLIRQGFASQHARLHMDIWLRFLNSILPVFSGAIFTSLIPLVEHFCVESDRVFQEVLDLSTGKGNVGPAPDIAVVGLMQGLEMLLVQAHRTLMEEVQHESLLKTPDRPSGLFSSATQSVFRGTGSPSQNNRTNSRLTVILAFQDTVRVCLKIWSWASANTDSSAVNTLNPLTTAYYAMKLRNKSRHLLEQIFSAEPLECLEVMISTWCAAPDPVGAEAPLRILHVMTRSRPKNTVPALLDAICSRVAPSTLPAARSSSLTVDMDAVDIMLFALGYLKSIEDDALDEVWPDCITFIRDALSNPLPYRQILPVMLSMLMILHEKLSNTNFGEQRKMKKELSDTLQRLLSATVTALPTIMSSESEPKTIIPKTADTNLELLKIARKTDPISILVTVVDTLDSLLDTPERVLASVNTICTNVITPNFHSKSFPANITSSLLALALAIAWKTPSAKNWRKDVTDAFNDNKLFLSSRKDFEACWFPILRQWTQGDRERMTDVLARLTAPSSAGIMFGVGANTARLEADRKTQYNLRRVCLLLLCAPENSYATHITAMEEKMTELFEATQASSPSYAVKAELFMLLRTILLCIDGVHIAGMWPILNRKLREALIALMPRNAESKAFNNIALLQGCKLLDQLAVMLPDEFQLCEWLYITDTSDAVYRPADLHSVALADQISTALTLSGLEENVNEINGPPSTNQTSRRPLLGDTFKIDAQDMKAMGREDFAKMVARPFLSQLSMHAYETVYNLGEADLDSCRHNLITDILDVNTMVE